MAAAAGAVERVVAEGDAPPPVTPSVVIAGGGTAGHVYPGLALAAAILRARPDASVSFVGTRRGIEVSAVPAAGFPLDLIEVTPWARTIGARRFLAPASLLGATRAAATVLSTRRATVAVGMGGYASLPVAVAARWAHLPLILHEQNAVPGLANVVAARLTPLVALAFAEARAAFPRSARCRVVGNPLRGQIATLEREVLRDEGRKRFGLREDRRTVFVSGGSLGAARLGAAAMELARRWAARGDVQVLLAAGRDHAQAARAAAAGLDNVTVADYIERMDLAYAAADVAVARAGAATVAELACAGLPAILVPYPYARRDHQRANAGALARAGAAIVVADAEATADRLEDEVGRLLGDPAGLARMASAARGFAKPHAADELAAWVLEVAKA